MGALSSGQIKIFRTIARELNLDTQKDKSFLFLLLSCDLEGIKNMELPKKHSRILKAVRKRRLCRSLQMYFS